MPMRVWPTSWPKRRKGSPLRRQRIEPTSRSGGDVEVYAADNDLTAPYEVLCKPTALIIFLIALRNKAVSDMKETSVMN